VLTVPAVGPFAGYSWKTEPVFVQYIVLASGSTKGGSDRPPDLLNLTGVATRSTPGRIVIVQSPIAATRGSS
jgi:hypothetical protein